MNTILTCPNCGKKCQVNSENLKEGVGIVCPGCGQKFFYHEPEAPTPVVPEPAPPYYPPYTPISTSKKSEGFFDETSDRWIRIFKGLCVAEFILFVVIGVIWAIGLTGLFVGVSGNPVLKILTLVILVVVVVLIAYFALAMNMLVIQLLKNIQTIRRETEEINRKMNL